MLERILSLPTAPFVEGHVLDFVRQFAHQRSLHCRADRFGNLVVSRTPTLPERPIIIVAHADHPGFIAREMLNKHLLSADWHGGVEAEYFVGTRVRFHAGLDGGIVGTVRAVQIDRTDSRRRVQRVTVEVRQEVPAGSPGTWDLPLFAMKGRIIHAARVDDIAGLGAALAAFDLLAEHNVRHQAAVLVTRAEEAGLIGASAAAFAHLLPRESIIVSIECSQMQPEAPQKAGPIVRVGDRASQFDPDLGDWLCRLAAEIAGHDKSFLWQRKLMPGGTCEASVFQTAGYRAAGLCIPLGNYHNRNAKRKRIEAETIDRQDWLGLVRLTAAVAASSPAMATLRPLARRFRELVSRYRPLLRDPLAQAATAVRRP